jgi:hypothetical protein
VWSLVIAAVNEVVAPGLLLQEVAGGQPKWEGATTNSIIKVFN